MKPALITTLALAGCAIDSPDPAPATAEARHAQQPHLLQTGTGLLGLEVTDDDYAIYQDGTGVFAAPLAGGPRRLVASDIPAGNTAFVYRVGRVAFVWTNPDRTLPNFGVSPLVIWSAATGPHLATSASAVGTLATAATRHGDHVIFPSNSTADGTTGDLVYASTDLAEQTTLVANAQMGFAVGPCNPLATFLDRDPVAIYCTTDPTTATLSRWTHGVRRDLVAAAFAPPSLAVDPERDRVLTLAAGSRNPLLVDRHGTVTTVAGASGRIPSFGPDGTIYYATRAAPPPAAAQLFRARDSGPQLLGDLQGVYTFAFGSRSFTQPSTSDDGRSFLVFDSFDPNTGFTNIVRLDARGGGATTVNAALDNTSFGPSFTSASTFALYAKGDPTFTTFTGAMFAAGCHGAPRQFSDDQGWAWLDGQGDTIVYNDSTVASPANLLLTTADLKVVDLGRDTLAARLVATQANATFYITHDQRAVVYTIDGDAPGLYVARIE